MRCGATWSKVLRRGDGACVCMCGSGGHGGSGEHGGGAHNLKRVGSALENFFLSGSCDARDAIVTSVTDIECGDFRCRQKLCLWILAGTVPEAGWSKFRFTKDRCNS